MARSAIIKAVVNDPGIGATGRQRSGWMSGLGAVLSSVPVISLLFIAAILPYALGLVPIVHFTSERIDVRVHPEEIFVDGDYFYKNPFPFPVVQGFTIPFPVDKDHPEPMEVHVERLTPAKEEIDLRRLFGKTAFDLYFAANEAVTIRVSYRQMARGANATYILTTTKRWGKPLESGVYTLCPHGTVIESSNYPIDLRAKAPSFQKAGFMPDKDWQFTWRIGHEKRM